MPLGRSHFANPVVPDGNPIESQIASVLWQWKFAEPNYRDSMLAASKFASMLEFWFPFSSIEYTRKRQIWCDGVPLFEIKEIGRVSFLVSGVGYFPHDFTPFELEFHFINRNDLKPSSVIFRFGLLDHNGALRMIGQNKHPSCVMHLRPTLNSQWAVAVELTEHHAGNAG